MNLLDIGEVAARSGMQPSALRFYEEKGLILSSGRRGLRRLFPSSVLDRLAVIALGREAGFSLDEIAAMFGSAQAKLTIDRAALLRKANELDAKVRRLTMMRDGLRHAAACSAPSHMECPKFRRLLSLNTLSRTKENP